MPLIISSDKRQFTVSADAGVRSQVIREALATGAGYNGDPIAVKASSAVLEKVLEFCDHYKLEPLIETDVAIQFAEPRNRYKEFTVWDLKFLNIDYGMLLDLVLAAKDMKIPDLLDLTCQAAAEVIKGKELAALIEMFKIHDDFSPREEAAPSQGA